MPGRSTTPCAGSGGPRSHHPGDGLCGEQKRALIKHPYVDPSRNVLVGRSFGGLIVPRGASGEHRLAAMIVDPGQLEMGSAVMNRLKFRRQSPDSPLP